MLELLVVVVIIGLLASYVGPKFFNQIGKSETAVAKAQILAFEKALDEYRLDLGNYPDEAAGLSALMTNTTQNPKWNGPYLKKEVPMDPWGRPYVYKLNLGQSHEVVITSFGKDGQPGGEGENQDISNN